ncbi:MAG: hypothetical protein IPN87_16965 [Saprospiraceae bacterium]|uniref:hypothetical protein n=1 Tax=Candidatus Brachybacter algidus TaxID=2982024 RepID=UPI001B431C87|nr:hypothetical protein [Candidatus Brachybacter algidus]MBP7540507.1 hypothetical protein [Saprospiraceae bacterium]MBK6450599.1 hypothetical protein [Candidatus Brachybacter algidus]MBK8604664.1 hypothetical protein [Candidatus Brachybacter algidus]MBK8842607.1 hypothetical protein [Candidatus Brachybacter algidus]MBP9126934.1 hypothetical protein [Saprospiraceae bacterium]
MAIGSFKISRCAAPWSSLHTNSINIVVRCTWKKSKGAAHRDIYRNRFDRLSGAAHRNIVCKILLISIA